MKYYDKNIYEMSNKIEIYVVIICIFIISFVLGYCSVRHENKENETNSINIVSTK